MEWHSDIGPQYEGEVVRKEDLWLEFGGPKVARKFELCRLKKPEQIEHEKVEVIGKDMNEMEEGGSYPIAIIVDVAGEQLDEDALPVLERRIHMFTSFIEGWYHMNQRADT
jgi:acetyl-CoA decarbonylase/synthase complex subunit beta